MPSRVQPSKPPVEGGGTHTEGSSCRSAPLRDHAKLRLARERSGSLHARSASRRGRQPHRWEFFLYGKPSTIVVAGALPADDAESALKSTCEFSRSMVGSAGTRQPAARRSLTHTHTHSQACRRARVPKGLWRRAPRATPGWVHYGCTCGHASSPPTASRPCARVRTYARGRAAGRGEGCRRSAPPNDGQAADHARPRLPEDATPAAVHVVRVDQSGGTLYRTTGRPASCHTLTPTRSHDTDSYRPAASKIDQIDR
jgi:hypothetical protein